MTAKVRLEPPDGGWGILVCIGMALQFIIGLSALPSFGLLFGDFLESVGAGTSDITIIMSVASLALSIVGLLSGSLFSRFGLRPAGLCATTLFFLGSVGQIFVNSTWALVFHFGVLQIGAFGMMIPACTTTFNAYFVKNRILWMSLTQSLIGLGAMLYPLVIQKLRDWYGFRGCLIVLAGINAHVILGMMLMHPVEWHMRRIEIEEVEELKEFMSEEKTTKKASPSIPQSKLTPNNTTPNLDEEKRDHLSPLDHDLQKLSRLSHEDLKPHLGPLGHHQHIKFSTEDLRIRMEPLGHEFRRHSKLSREELKINSRLSSSLASLGNWTGPIVVSDVPSDMVIRSRTHSQSVRKEVAAVKVEEPKLTMKQKIVDFLDLTLMKRPVFINIVLGTSFVLYSDMTFFTLQPLYLFELQFSNHETANIIAIGAAADLASRIFLAFSAFFIQMPARYIYTAGAFFTILARFVFLYVHDFVGVACATALMGFLRTWLHVPLPLVFAEYLPQERFAKGYGLFMFLQGMTSFVIGPFVGYLRDVTNDYILVFHILNLIMAFCAVPWIVEIICVKFRRKQKIQTTVMYK